MKSIYTNSLFLSLLFLLFATACNPLETPIPGDPKPVFKFESKDLQSWYAGKNGYYQDAALQTLKNYRIYVSKLINEVDGSFLAVYLTDKLDTTAYNADSSFGGNFYPFAAPGNIQTGILARFTPTNPNNIASTLWNFGDGSTSTETNPSHFFAGSGSKNVLLRLTTLSSCISFSSERINLVASQDSTCLREILVTADSLGKPILEIVNPDPSSIYNWTIGSSFFIGTRVNYNAQFQGIFPVKLSIENPTTGCKSTLNTSVSFPVGIGCPAGFSTTLRNFSQEIPFFVPGMVQIIYGDASGKIFNSNTIAQDSDAFFQILNHEPYKLNNLGKPTQKLEIKTKCVLKANDGSTISLNNAIIVGAVEVPR